MRAVISSSTAAVVHNHQDNWNEWTLNSGAMDCLSRDATDLYDDVTASPGTTVEVANDTHEEVQGYGKLGLFVKQSGGKQRRPP